jgi:hypothetical protein
MTVRGTTATGGLTTNRGIGVATWIFVAPVGVTVLEFSDAAAALGIGSAGTLTALGGGAVAGVAVAPGCVPRLTAGDIVAIAWGRVGAGGAIAASRSGLELPEALRSAGASGADAASGRYAGPAASPSSDAEGSRASPLDCPAGGLCVQAMVARTIIVSAKRKQVPGGAALPSAWRTTKGLILVLSVVRANR